MDRRLQRRFDADALEDEIRSAAGEFVHPLCRILGGGIDDVGRTELPGKLGAPGRKFGDDHRRGALGLAP